MWCLPVYPCGRNLTRLQHIKIRWQQTSRQHGSPRLTSTPMYIMGIRFKNNVFLIVKGNKKLGNVVSNHLLLLTIPAKQKISNIILILERRAPTLIRYMAKCTFWRTKYHSKLSKQFVCNTINKFSRTIVYFFNKYWKIVLYKGIIFCCKLGRLIS